MKTTAQQIADLLGNDGQNFDVPGLDSVTLDDVARQEYGGRQEWRDGQRNVSGGYYRWNFGDGSAIVVQYGYCWDFPLDSNPDCYCFEGGGPEHNDGCPAGAEVLS